MHAPIELFRLVYHASAPGGQSHPAVVLSRSPDRRKTEKAAKSKSTQIRRRIDFEYFSKSFFQSLSGWAARGNDQRLSTPKIPFQEVLSLPTK
jgi:hypothetical protein